MPVLIKIQGSHGIATVAFMLVSMQVYSVAVFHVRCKCTVVEHPRPNDTLQQQPLGFDKNLSLS